MLRCLMRASAVADRADKRSTRRVLRATLRDISVEELMAFVTADVVPDPGNDPPFKVVFMQGKTVIVEWPVETAKEGEEQIIEFLRSAVEDDEDDDDDDDDGDDAEEGRK